MSLGRWGGRLPVSEANALVGGPPRIPRCLFAKSIKLSCSAESGGGLTDLRNKGFAHSDAQ
jgi:hypothetical protein